MEFLAKLGINLNNLQDISKWNHLVWIKLVCEVGIIGYALIWVWVRIRGTQAERLVKGILVLTFICVFSALVGFTLITSILQQLIPVAVIALLIIFQPEIRRGLGYLGRSTAFKIDLSLSVADQSRSYYVVDQIIAGVRELARTKTGALIVIEPMEGERDYLSPGIRVNADVSSNLLLSIFFPRSPLHDGAVIIRKDKIVAAGVLLRMTDNPNLGHKYGTRHRAALGLSEIYDGLCIVVSEQTGAISAASHGILVKYNNADELSSPLSYIYKIGNNTKTFSPLQAFFTLFNKKRKKKNNTKYGTALSTLNQNDMKEIT